MNDEDTLQLRRELAATKREARAARPLLASYGADLMTVASILREAGCEGDSAVEIARDAARRLAICEKCEGWG